MVPIEWKHRHVSSISLPGSWLRLKYSTPALEIFHLMLSNNLNQTLPLHISKSLLITNKVKLQPPAPTVPVLTKS
jgi:hypothetical protein